MYPLMSSLVNHAGSARRHFDYGSQRQRAPGRLQGIGRAIPIRQWHDAKQLVASAVHMLDGHDRAELSGRRAIPAEGVIFLLDPPWISRGYKLQRPVVAQRLRLAEPDRPEPTGADQADDAVAVQGFISPARQHDVRWLDDLFFEAGAFYVMGRSYMDFKRMDLIVQAAAFFVTRAKDNLQFARQVSRPVDYPSGVRSDQIGKPKLTKARADFPSRLRKVRYYHEETGRDLVFLTNNLSIPALTVAALYRLRWRIEQKSMR